MTKVIDLYHFLDGIAPFELQEDYDNAGIIVGDPEMEVTGVMMCLDSTEAIIDEAIQRNCNVIIAHHPIIFSGLKQLVGANYVQRTVMKAIRNDIAILAIHTNLDNVLANGVNEMIAKKLGLSDLSILAPKQQDVIDDVAGAGLVGYYDDHMSAVNFLDLLKEKMQLDVVKHTALCYDEVKKIAICGGSGGFLLEHAKSAGAHVFVTSDYKYHEYFDADNDIIIADIGHYESEQYTIELLYKLIKENFSTFAAHYTQRSTNPVYYY